MLKSFLALAAVLALCSVAHSQVISFGKCPHDIHVIPKFDVSQYLGKWYEYSKYPALFELGGKCVTADYSLNNGTIDVVNTQIDELTGHKRSVKGTAKVVENAKLLVDFPLAPTPKHGNYWVLDTDYSTFSVVYSCQSFFGIRATFVWILTREQTPRPAIVATAESVLTGNGISLKDLAVTDQTNCN